MKVALILSVVALVAVSQPWNAQVLPPKPFQECQRLGPQPFRCCRPQTFGGCVADPYARPGAPPSPQFLTNVCCPSTHECCVRDQNINPAFLSYTCCDTADGHVCNVEDGQGSCIEALIGNGTTPSSGVEHLEAGGQCPLDGSLPARFPDGRVIQCSLNVNINADCPNNHYCVRDNSGNVNAGVCCLETTDEDGDMIGCDKYETCNDCVRNEDRVQAPCGWLSQGSLSNVNPRCVKNCENFPSKSCILPSGGELCPVSDTENGTVVNTGTCERRCGYIGTGRAARINNNGNRIPPTPENVTQSACCTDYPGDYCCDVFGQIATHCSPGRRPDSQVLCGVPLRGTPNALYVPANEPLGPYMPQQPTPYPTQFGPFPPYGQPYGYGPHRPYGYGPAPYPVPYGPGPVPYGPGPVPYGPVPYGPIWRAGEELTDEKMLYMAPPPMYYQPPPPRPPRPTPPIVSINPSPFVCSCDDHCSTYDDCCEDYDDYCILTEEEEEEEAAP